MIDTTMEAKIAISELDSAGYKVEPDRLADAQYYAQEAIDLLQESTGYDPHTVRPVSAKMAVRAFVKARLLGVKDPERDPLFVFAAQQWERKANADNAYDYWQNRQTNT